MITVILMPFRKNNLKKIIQGIRNQTISSEIWIYDDSGNYKGFGEDVYFYCNKSFLHRPRFVLCGMVKTEYVMIHDDDFAITNNNLFKELIELSKKRPDYLIGHRGKIFDKNSDQLKPYQNGYGWIGEGECQFVNTGLSFFRTETINNLPVNAYHNKGHIMSEFEYKFADDMWISVHNKCYSTDLFLNSCEKLPEEDLGVSHKPEHMDLRNIFCKRYWLS